MTPPHGPQPHAKLGFPWALVSALLIVLAVECFLHTRNRLDLIAYASDEGQYHAVRDTIRAEGPADVALVGSSQVQQGIVMPLLVEELEKKLGKPVRVANYATRGARPDAMNAVVRYLQKQPTPPKLIVVGVGPRDLRAESVDWPRVALFWDAADWAAAYRRYGFISTDLLPVVFRNEAGKFLYSLNYREEISLTIKRAFQKVGFNLDTDDGNNPIRGEVVYQHIGSRGQRSLANTNVSLKRILLNAQSQYLFNKPAKPIPAMAAATKDLVQALGRSPQASLLVQMPVAEALQNQIIQSGQAKAFGTLVTTLSADARVPFIPADEQNLSLTNSDFYDLQHLNRPGAEKFSRWLANRIADRMSNTP
jgi:hypothetical protein